MSPDELWQNVLSKHAPKNVNDLVISGTYPSTNGREFNEIGIDYEHAFTVLDVFEVTYRARLLNKVTARIIKVRNGNRLGPYIGPWSVGDRNWHKLSPE
jgi:hypothetical protein